MPRANPMRWAVISGPEVPTLPTPIAAADPLKLRPIPWGERDTDLARGLCQHIAEATPPTVIPFNPLTDARVRRHLRSMRIYHH